ncbi:MAG: hypothetical protein LBN07_04415 [Christensenellaceae bacterium]|jgi:hypothetical protein|nr:hypothetical protein [Christensenellaceae bacterium]
MIKPSAYLLNVQSEIRNRFFGGGLSSILEYPTNLGAERDLTKIKPMPFSHSIGLECERSMTGPADVIMLREDLKKLKTIKHKARKELGEENYYKEFDWFDGEPLEFLPYTTNLVHSTDDPSEASLHFLISYPEHQVMTRFMYPNPALAKESEQNFERSE